ncbi:hypothetical protein ACVXZZ_03420 [Staphylococcus aureus]
MNKSSEIPDWKSKINDFIDFCLSEEVSGNKGAVKMHLFGGNKLTLEIQKCPQIR